MFIARLCLMLAILLVPLLGGASGVMPLAVFAVLAAGGWLAWASARPSWRSVPVRWPLLALAAVTLLATLVSVYRPVSVLGCWQLATVLALMLLAFQVPFTRDQLWLGLGLFGLSVIAGQLYGIYFWLTWLLEKHELSWRIQSTWVNANFYAAFLLLALPPLLALAVHAPRAGWRLVGAIAVAQGALVLVFTQSRGALLAAMVVAVVLGPVWLWAEGKLNRPSLLRLGVGLAIFIGVALALPFGQRILNPAVRDTQAHSQRFRLYTWKVNLAIAKDHPLLGTGPGTYASVMGKYQTAGYTVHGHHIYLQAAAETGLLGLGALLWLFVSLAWLAIRVLRRPGDVVPRALAAALLAGGAALGLHGLVDSDWLFPGVQLALLLPAAVMWTVAEPDEAMRPASVWARALPAAGMCVVSLALLAGARAEQLMLDADSTFRMIFTTQDTAQQRAYYQQAIGEYKDAIALAPTNAAYLRRAGAHPLLPETRIDYLNRARALEPTNSANWVALGDFYSDQKEPAKAIDAYRTALARQPRQLDILYRMAVTYWGLRNVAATKEQLRAILDTIGTPLDTVRPISVPEPFYTQAWYATAVLAAPVSPEARAAYAKTIEYAHKYEDGFTLEAEAVAAMTNNTLERERMRQLAATAYVRLNALDPKLAAQYANQVDQTLALPEKAWGNPFP